MVLFRRSRPGRPDRAAIAAVVAEETTPTVPAGAPTPAGSVAPAVPAA
ncbi:dihydrolipoyllysine-residue succinyltransferase, partial [Micromonospora aurantiaca]|nr:dihydrolipoyllysine-residue succinyltransferase [Micromonospora aurantiaca]